MKKHILRLLMTLTLCLSLTLCAAAADTAGAKEAIRQGIENRETTIELEPYGIGQEEIWALLQEVLTENPRFYYARGGGSICYRGNTVTSLSAYYLDGLGEAEDAAYETAAEAALCCVLPGMNDAQKALVLHDWLVLHSAYDYEHYLNGTIPEMSYSAYGAMALKTSVCEGYARAYADLLSRCGIPCITVSSTAMNHTWNQVCIDDCWYHIDVTWDDPVPDTPGLVSHTYFLKSDAAIQGGDRPHSGWSGGYSCTDTRYDSGAPWEGMNSALCFTDADTLYLLRTTGEYTAQTVSLIRQDLAGGTEATAASVKDYWRVWGSNRYWLGSYSGLALMDGYLYYNDTLHIYRYDPESGAQTTALTLTGEDGYLYGLYAADGGLFYRLSTAPEKSGTVYALETEKSPFLDIPLNSEYYPAALWALNRGVTTGTNVDRETGMVTFSPENSCTRGQVVTFLWRAMGEPEPTMDFSPFPDVMETDYFYKAVLWAVEQGITNGSKYDEEGRLCFGPEDSCTYAHILTFLWRCVAYVESSGDTWYAAPVAWAAENGLLNGVDITDSPAQCLCPRKAVVLFLYRCAA